MSPWSFSADGVLAGPLAHRRLRRPLRGPRVDFRERCREHVELLLPVLAVTVHPHGCIEQRTGVETAAADTPAALLLDQPGAHQNLDVSRYGLERNFERGS